MAVRPDRTEFAVVLRRAVRPPVREGRFWVIQGLVVLIATVHLIVDLHSPLESGAFPSGIPVALLIIPVGYAALRYGLSGSAATGLWATLLWLPDLLLSRDQGHVGDDLINLALVLVVAFAIGHRIETERLAHAQAAQATADRLAVEARYRLLFDANAAPILVLDARGVIRDANLAARSLLGHDIAARSSEAIFGADGALEEQAGRVLCLPDGRDYRVELAALPIGTDSASTQVILDDVTEERAEGLRATRYAALVVQAEEDQRRRLARELHDEPLQLFLHLARRLEILGGTSGVPSGVASALAEARSQALDAARRLRNLSRDLRPPALDQLGMVAALESLLADVEEGSGLASTLEVTGDKARLSPEVELGAFRIIQEAVRNTLRHAEACELHVRLHFASDEVGISVADDGRGFSPESPDELAPAHLGLLGMRERAHLLRGRLEVRSTPGEGTVVEASIPLGALGGAADPCDAMAPRS
jgi:signal transduction histidine kinase